MQWPPYIHSDPWQSCYRCLWFRLLGGVHLSADCERQRSGDFKLRGHCDHQGRYVYDRSYYLYPWQRDVIPWDAWGQSWDSFSALVLQNMGRDTCLQILGRCAWGGGNCSFYLHSGKIDSRIAHNARPPVMSNILLTS